MGVEGQRASRLEILGAWLNLWTPPYDVEIPPPPSPRTLLGLALALAALVAVAAFVIAPPIRAGKEERAARDERIAAQRDAAERARLAAEQRPRTGRLRSTSRSEAVRELGRLVGRDARLRFARDARAADCTPAPGTDPEASRIALHCFVATAEIVGAGTQGGARGWLGIPYRAVVELPGGDYAFCKANPPPGEQAAPDPRRTVALPDACTLRRR